MLGSLTDLPRLMFRPVEQLGANQGWKQASGRLLRMHQKSLKWGTRYVGCLLVRVVVGWFGSSFRRGIVRLVPELLLCASIPCCCLFIVDCVCVCAQLGRNLGNVRWYECGMSCLARRCRRRMEFHLWQYGRWRLLSTTRYVCRYWKDSGVCACVCVVCYTTEIQPCCCGVSFSD